MSYNSLTHTFRLRSRRAEALQFLQCHEASMPLEAHMRLLAVLRRGGKIMIQTRQSPGLEETVSCFGCNPFGKVLAHNAVAEAVDAERMVVGFLWESLLDRGLGFLNDLRIRPNAGKVYG